MKYAEASKLIMKLSDDYSTNLSTEKEAGFLSGYSVYYKGELVAYVSTKEMYGIYPANYSLYKLPYGNKLWMILSELAMTKSSDRVIEPKYNVIIGNNPSDRYEYIVWQKTGSGVFEQDVVKTELLSDESTQFSPSEYSKLIEFIKTLPDGEFQVMVANHGKALVKDDD